VVWVLGASVEGVGVEVRGDRVRQARLLRRLDGKVVAERVGWSPATQTRLEGSKSKRIHDEAASKLARTLRVPIEFLTTINPTPNMSIEDLRFRAPKKTTKQEKEYLVEFARWISEISAQMDGIHNLPPVRVPKCKDGETVQDAAAQVREAFAVGPHDPIGHLTHSVERLGVIVVVRVPDSSDSERWDRSGDASIEKPEKGERHFGYSTWIGTFGDRPLTVLRLIDSWERTRWTVAHELGHLVYHRDCVSEDAEIVASRFASELLAPAAALSAEIGKHVTLAELVPLKLKWGISLGALIRHLRQSSLISDERSSALSRQLYTRINPATGRTWGMDEPGGDSRDPERPRMLSRWAERCFGTASAAGLASINRAWPTELLNVTLSSQRRPGGQGPTEKAAKASSGDEPPESNVVQLFG
jgi:Zn-dependent peptidase ImmA (M78 family)/transcriptional regulator with XRE-family HTH domain